MSIKVLVADSQRLFAQSLAGALRGVSDLSVVGEQPISGLETLEAVIRHGPDLVLLDFWITGMSGPAATREIRSAASRPNVVILSWLHGRHHVKDTLDAGAAAFMAKSMTLDFVVDTIRRAHRGEPIRHGPEMTKVTEDLTKRDQPDEQWQRLLSMTPREVQILQRLSEGPDPQQIAAELCITVGTVRNHMSRILAKIGARTSLEAIAMARRWGVIREMGPPNPDQRSKP